MAIAIRSVLVGLFGAALAAQTVVEKPLPAASDWRAHRIHTAETGVWYARVAPVVPWYGAPDVLVTDDRGQLTVLSVYSGKWTPRSVNCDGQWLAPSAPADVDPRQPGAEIYAAGKAGNVHQIVRVDEPYGQFRFVSREIGHVAGEEFHAIVAADLRPERPGDELLAFGMSGRVIELVPAADGPGFVSKDLADVKGRVRDVVVLPAEGSVAPRLVGVSRSGDLLLMRLSGQGLERRVLAHEPMGLGRIARRLSTGNGDREVLYVTRDDGLLLCFQEQPDGSWRRESMFAGAQGLRGVVAGRFFSDPAIEAVAVYGYRGKVQLVWRAGAGPWRVDSIFGDEAQGHWLAVGELDGRNGTDELIATGFGGQVVLLARPPGHGLTGAAIDETAVPAVPAVTAATPQSLPETASGPRPVRIAVKASDEAVRELSPLNYQGGFETKSMVYETLVRRGADGAIVPGLASSWQISGDGREFTFTLRAGATFHDGTPVTAAAVATHFRRWVGLPEHGWLPSNEHIAAVEAVDAGRLRIRLAQPCALLPDLCAINPTAIRAPSALDREGRFVRPVGSGPWAFVGVREDGRVLRYRAHGAGPERLVDLVLLAKDAAVDPLAVLQAGDVDVVLSSWLVTCAPARVHELRRDPKFRVGEGPGSSVVLLAMSGRGATADLALRRRIAAAIDRAALVADVEAGLADPCTGFAAPSVTIWPQGRAVGPARAAEAAAAAGATIALRLHAGRHDERHPGLAAAIAAQLRRAGFTIELTDQPRDADLRLDVTHGVPYDPFLTAMSRFLPPPGPTAESPRGVASSPRLQQLAARAAAATEPAARHALYAELQAAIDDEVPFVPLYARRRVAVVRADLPLPVLDHDLYHLDPSWLFAAR